MSGKQGTMMKRSIYLIILMVSCVQGCQRIVAPKDQVCFKDRCFNVEIAQTADDLRRGLMHRKSLEEHSGMLFIFSQAGRYDFWMKDTRIPLDIIWLDEEKKVIYVAENVSPCKQDPCPSVGAPAPSRYVLEINAQKAKALGITTGDRAQFRLSGDFQEKEKEFY